MLDLAGMPKKSLSVVVPVYNEEEDIAKNVPKLHSFLTEKMGKYDWEIVIADNASIDRTPEISKSLLSLGRIKYTRLDQKGRGRALKKVWGESQADYLSYMDVDLSSDLDYLPKLIDKLEDGVDIAVGSRLAKGSKVIGRTLIREMMSRGYSLLFRTIFRTEFKDAQCGFKAIKRQAAKEVLPLVLDTGWFFDTELLVIAQKCGFKIAEVPIYWQDDPASTVKVAKTAWGDIEGIWRLIQTRPWEKRNS